MFNKKMQEKNGNYPSISFLQATSYQLSAASFGLVEVIIGVSVLAASVVILFSVILYSQRVAADATTKIQVALLLQEGAEAIRSLRDVHAGQATWNSSISNYGDGAKRCIIFSASSYSITNPSSTNCASELGKYERSLTLQCANRDLPGNIEGWTNCGSAEDPNTVKALISVSWVNRNGVTKNEPLETIIINR